MFIITTDIRIFGVRVCDECLSIAKLYVPHLKLYYRNISREPTVNYPSGFLHRSIKLITRKILLTPNCSVVANTQSLNMPNPEKYSFKIPPFTSGKNDP